jgi:hypothetical protein
MFHEAMQAGEIFLGNTKTENLRATQRRLQSLHTLRVGHQALDIHGQTIDPSYMLPLFLHQSEQQKYDSLQK